MSDLKHKGISKKVQGEQADPKSLSDARQEHMPRSISRGIGSSYADAVRTILDSARSMKGSQTDFLGVPKQTIDPKQFAHDLKKKKRK